MTIPKKLREEFGLEAGDEPHWEKTEDGIQIWKATQSVGRGRLIYDDISEAKREEMAEGLEADICK